MILWMLNDSTSFYSQVGMFPDVLESKVMRHFEEGDHVRHLYFDSKI